MEEKMPFHSDRARALETFAAVISEGSFSAAGRLLGLTPSAVSRAIDRIEDRLADSALTARKLGENGRVIVASPAYLERHGTPLTPEDLHSHNCLNFNFRRAEPVWPFRDDGRDYALSVHGSIEANNGETLGQLAADGVGITRVGRFSVQPELASGQLVPILEDYNPGDVEAIHAVFLGGVNLPARVRVFVDFLAEKLACA